MRGDRFVYHKPGEHGKAALTENRRRFRELRDHLKTLPACPEQQSAFTYLHIASMFANAAIALNDEDAEVIEQQMADDLGTVRLSLEDIRPELDRLVSEHHRVCYERDRMRTAIEFVLADAESQHPGGWGPDITMVEVLKKALKDEEAEVTD